MTHHTPLTTEHLAEIEARTKAATPGPWVRYAEYGPTFYANTSGEYLRGVGDFNFGVGYQADADEAFVRHAPEDVRLLLAEVARLKGQRKCLLTQLAKRDAESGRGDAALRKFLASADPICGDPNDGDWCELEPGHDGHHRADTAEWAQTATAAAGESGSTR